MKKTVQPCVAAVLSILLLTGFVFAATKDEAKKRDFILCGVSTGVPGFSNPDEKGNWTGLDADVCRAVAAAVLGDAAKVKFVPLPAKERIVSLQSGAVDLLAGNVTWTFTRDTSLGINFAGVSYYGGQRFLVPAELGVKSALDLDGVAVCVQSGTTVELNVSDFFRQNDMKYKPVLLDTATQAVKGFESGRCRVLSSNKAQLLGMRLKMTRPESAVLLPELIAKEPMGPVVMQGDDAWFNIVRWTLYAMIVAEELGIDSQNVDRLKANPTPSVARFLGLEGIKGEGLGLPADWAYQIILQVGNYGEVFDRNLGSGSLLKLDRGPNSLWTQGGLLYAPPFR